MPGRCRATNKCAYCQSLYVIETVEALTLDALGGDAPTLWIVLTAREHLTRPAFNEHLRLVREKLRRRGWEWEHFVEIEFQRRGALHANLLVKLRAGGAAEAFIAELTEGWCARVDAEPVGQWGEAIDDALAVSKYVSKVLAHGLKAEQRPPLGWKGHRTSHTRGYFGRAMWRVRRDARASLQRKRELWRAEASGLGPAEAEGVADAEAMRAARVQWELVVVDVDHAGEVRRVRPAAGGGTVTAMRSDEPGELRRDREENAGRALRALDELQREEAAASTSAVRAEAPPRPHPTLPGLATSSTKNRSAKLLKPADRSCRSPGDTT